MTVPSVVLLISIVSPYIFAFVVSVASVVLSISIVYPFMLAFVAYFFLCNVVIIYFLVLINLIKYI